MRLSLSALTALVALVACLTTLPLISHAAITVTPLPFVPSAMSGDGNVVYGLSSPPVVNQRHLVKWTADGGMQTVASFPTTNAFIWDVSDDGSVVTGSARQTNFGFFEPFVWTAHTGFQFFPNLMFSSQAFTPLSGDGTTAYNENNRLTPGPVTTMSDFARGINHDGSVIGVIGGPGQARAVVNGVPQTIPIPGGVGINRIFAITPDDLRLGEDIGTGVGLVFLWKGDQIQVFPKTWIWNPLDISDDGQFAVGYDFANTPNSATIFTAGQQHRLRNYLIDHGVDAATLPIRLDFAPDISNDGTKLIAANTFNLPAGTGTGYLITLPEPASAAVLALLCAGACISRCRRLLA